MVECVVAAIATERVAFTKDDALRSDAHCQTEIALIVSFSLTAIDRRVAAIQSPLSIHDPSMRIPQ